jgi:acyl carrier protein
MATDDVLSQNESGELRTTTERSVAALWSEVLDCEEALDATTDFFEIGGDSVAMATILFRIQEEFSVELPAGAIFGAPSVRQLSILVDSARSSSAQ